MFGLLHHVGVPIRAAATYNVLRHFNDIFKRSLACSARFVPQSLPVASIAVMAPVSLWILPDNLF